MIVGVLQVGLRWLIEHRWHVLAAAALVFVLSQLWCWATRGRCTRTLRLRSRREQERFNPLSTVHNSRSFSCPRPRRR